MSRPIIPLKTIHDFAAVLTQNRTNGHWTLISPLGDVFVAPSADDACTMSNDFDDAMKATLQ